MARLTKAEIARRERAAYAARLATLNDRLIEQTARADGLREFNKRRKAAGVEPYRFPRRGRRK